MKTREQVTEALARVRVDLNKALADPMTRRYGVRITEHLRGQIKALEYVLSEGAD